MKSNARILILLLAVLTLLGWYQVLGITEENRTAYREALAEAESCTEEGVYEKALDAYGEALSYEDTLEIRLKMNQLYRLCLEDGSTRYTALQYEKFLSQTIVLHPETAESYEISAGYWYGQDKYLKCYGVLQQAEKNGVSSGVLEEYLGMVKYQCRLEFTRYTGFLPCFQGSMAVCTTEVWNYVDGTGKILLNGDYEEAAPFGEKIAIVKKNGTIRLIDEHGAVQEVLGPEILSVEGSFGDGMAPVRTAAGYTYIDREGRAVLGTYDHAGVFCNGVAAVRTGEHWQVIDTSGKVVLDSLDAVVLDGLGRCAPQNVILAAVKGGYALYALDGTRIMTEEYEDADSFLADGTAAVKQNGKWGYIDLEGNWVLEPVFQEAKSFSGGLAGISVDGLWGFIDSNGKIVIPCTYENVDYWNEEGCCMVFTGGFWKLLKRICI